MFFIKFLQIFNLKCICASKLGSIFKIFESPDSADSFSDRGGYRGVATSTIAPPQTFRDITRVVFKRDITRVVTVG